MNSKKIIAVLLSATMLMAAVTGCTKVKKVDLKSMDKAAEKVEAETYDDVEEFLDDGEDDLEDGVYLTMDEDAIEDVIDEIGIDDDDLEDIIDEINDYLDADIDFSLDDLTEAAVYLKVDDENVALVAYIDVGESNLASEVFGIVTNEDNLEDAQDELEDLADEVDYDLDGFTIDLDKLGSDEYYNGKNSGYIKFCITQDFLEDLVENDITEAFEEADLDDYLEDVEDMADEMPYDVMAGGIYYNGGVIVVTFIATDDEDMIEDYESFMSTIGLKSPTKVKPSKYLRELITTALVVSASYEDQMKSSRHNAEITDVVAEIDANY